MKRGEARAAAAVELAAVLLITAAAFAWGQRAALIERGYTARGGEYLLLLIPEIYYITKRIIVDWIKEIKKTWRRRPKPETLCIVHENQSRTVIDRTAKSLEIAFMGYNNQRTKETFRQFAEDNREEIRTDLSELGLLLLKDGTRITAITPEKAGLGVRGYNYDQLILADDSRKKIYSVRCREINLFMETAMDLSRVPENYKILFYDTDAPDPRREIGKGDRKSGTI